MAVPIEVATGSEALIPFTIALGAAPVSVLRRSSEAQRPTPVGTHLPATVAQVGASIFSTGRLEEYWKGALEQAPREIKYTFKALEELNRFNPLRTPTIEEIRQEALALPTQRELHFDPNPYPQEGMMPRIATPGQIISQSDLLSGQVRVRPGEDLGQHLEIEQPDCQSCLLMLCPSCGQPVPQPGGQPVPQPGGQPVRKTTQTMCRNEIYAHCWEMDDRGNIIRDLGSHPIAETEMLTPEAATENAHRCAG